MWGPRSPSSVPVKPFHQKQTRTLEPVLPAFRRACLRPPTPTRPPTPSSWPPSAVSARPASRDSTLQQPCQGLAEMINELDSLGHAAAQNTAWSLRTAVAPRTMPIRMTMLRGGGEGPTAETKHHGALSSGLQTALHH